ncbi:MAG: circularly permuted type 2 ATP-grasp protein [Candidatus Acidiferrales bacterium]
MHPPISREAVDTNPDSPHSLAGNYPADPAIVDEMIAADGSLRPHWQQFVSMLDRLSPEELRRCREHARRLMRENGVTHTVYGDPAGWNQPWNLDLIPLLIPVAQWAQVREGLIQRARLLDALLADLYGPMRTVLDGVLPPELLWANRSFLRACHGTKLPGNRWLHLYAADLVRTPDGGYEVLNDRTQAPSGAGYSLENRIVLSRTLPATYRESKVQRLAPFFGALRDSLLSLAPANRPNPRIVLLTPGPYNEAYFEHSYLARYLGYPLVHGNDLTVRDATVYLKTVGGLQRVDVILRRVDDNFCDPLELFAGSYLGVPGLLHSIRQGNVAVANALGTGVLQAPGLLPFLPGIARHLLGEDLKLPSVSTWWCGQPKELQFVLEHLSELVVKSAYPTLGEDPIFGPSLTRAQLDELGERIKGHPDQYVAQAQVMCCTTPALIDDQVQPRRYVVRSFLAACGDSYAVMDGGLTRINPSSDSLVVSLQRGGGTKDTWILSDGPVSQMTLLVNSRQRVLFNRGGGDLPSRIADDLFWLGRYVERAEARARLARAAFTRAIEQDGRDDAHATQVLAAALHVTGFPAASTSRAAFVHGVMGDEDGAGIGGLLAQVHNLARIHRERLSPDSWRILENIQRRVGRYKPGSDVSVADWLHLLNDLVVTLAAFIGLSADSMMHSQAWRFLDMGRRLERALFLARLLGDTLANPGTDPALLEAILEITESAFPYRRRYLMQLETEAIVDLLVADENNPRGVAFQFATIAKHLAALPHDASHPSREHDNELLSGLRASLQTANLNELCAVVEGQSREGLAALLSDVVDRATQLSNAIAHLYFSHAAISPVLWQMSEETAT